MSFKNILVLSDTHMPSRGRVLPAAVQAVLPQADLILHAGDLTTGGVLEELRSHALVVAVAGNNDTPELCAELPRQAVVPAGAFRIGLVHGDGPGGNTFSRAAGAFAAGSVDCVVFGHSHQPLASGAGTCSTSIRGRQQTGGGSRATPSRGYGWGRRWQQSTSTLSAGRNVILKERRD